MVYASQSYGASFAVWDHKSYLPPTQMNGPHLNSSQASLIYPEEAALHIKTKQHFQQYSSE